jgi:hypothetical protein
MTRGTVSRFWHQIVGGRAVANNGVNIITMNEGLLLNMVYRNIVKQERRAVRVACPTLPTRLSSGRSARSSEAWKLHAQHLYAANL